MERMWRVAATFFLLTATDLTMSGIFTSPQMSHPMGVREGFKNPSNGKIPLRGYPLPP